MFDGQDVAEQAITVTSVTFQTADGERVYIRTDMKARVDDGYAVVNPWIKEIKTKATDKLKTHMLSKPGFLDGKEKHKAWALEKAKLESQVANPLMDIPNPEGSMIVNKILEGLKGRGLAVQKKTEHSNGEIVERKWIFQ